MTNEELKNELAVLTNDPKLSADMFKNVALMYRLQACAADAHNMQMKRASFVEAATSAYDAALVMKDTLLQATMRLLDKDESP